jgi:murein DD-endopeptidase MepM/ murein hydrolase activator NlpD
MARQSRRKDWPVILAGLGGFLLGAATVLVVVWIYTSQVRMPLGSVGAMRPDSPTSPTPPTVRTPAPVLPFPGSPPAASAPTPSQTAAPALPLIPLSADLASRNLLLPVQGIRPEQLADTFNQSRGGERRHEALDIMAQRGTPVLAVEDGRVVKLFTSKQGGLTIYEFDPTETYAYYYAHLDRYTDGLQEGEVLRRGQVLGYVGSTGNASPDAPHLHFAIFRLTPEKQWWKGTPVNPFGLLR